MKKFKGVALDPKLNPPENIDRLFERARKATRARPILEDRLGRTHWQVVVAEHTAAAVAAQALPRRDGEPRLIAAHRALEGHRPIGRAPIVDGRQRMVATYLGWGDGEAAARYAASDGAH